MKKFFRNQIYPKLFFLPFYLHKLVLGLFVLLYPQKRRFNSNIESKLLISAGIRGWDSIEFKELLDSAREYFNNENSVIQHKVSSPDAYYDELKITIVSSNITHALYDPRTGKQGSFSGLIDSIRIAWLFARYQVTPIVLLTDLSHRNWRIKSSMVSAVSGIVICFVLPRLVWPIFPHRRLYGPFTMPFSRIKLNSIRTSLYIDYKERNNTKSAFFVGSLYEPRITRLNNIKNGLIAKGLDLEIRGRVIGGPRRPDVEYWKTLAEPVVITTADQIFLNELDWAWVPSLIYRYIEALACGSLLVAPSVPAVSRYFRPNIDFVPFTTDEDAIQKIEYYLKNPKERINIASSGYERAKQLIESQSFWIQIDTCLSKNSLL